MVLICNNNILTIDTFHKHRCEEKKDIKDIIINRKYLKDEYEEEPEKEKETNTTFIISTESGDSFKHVKGIYLSR
jgi:hypothetical protein